MGKNINRRIFIRNSALTAGALAFAGRGMSANLFSKTLREEAPQLKLSYNLERKFKIVRGQGKTVIVPYA